MKVEEELHQNETRVSHPLPIGKCGAGLMYSSVKKTPANPPQVPALTKGVNQQMGRDSEYFAGISMINSGLSNVVKSDITFHKKCVCVINYHLQFILNYSYNCLSCFFAVPFTCRTKPIRSSSHLHNTFSHEAIGV